MTDDQVNQDDGNKQLRLKMRQMENYVIRLTDEEFEYLLRVVESEIEERERERL